ncbi:MAG: ATP-binding protein [Phycisphaeraceae bacterium]
MTPTETAILVAALAVIGLMWIWVWRTWSRVAELRQYVEQITAGSGEQRLRHGWRGHIGGLSRALMRMANEFQSRLRTLRQQRNELEAVLASMIEGVLAVDLDERVISFNRAAGNLLKLSPSAVGRSIQEVIRNTSLQQFVSHALISTSPAQADLVLRIDTTPAPGTVPGIAPAPGMDADVEGDERYLQAQAAALNDAAGVRIGALIVLHDVTRLRRLEMVRRDFVANVSHEVKTPITAIKGAVETLIDAGETEYEQQQRFFQMISRQADRLSAIVEDLLALARIEQDTERDHIELNPVDLCQVIRSAVEVCEHMAKARRITLRLAAAQPMEVSANAPLLEQAVVNLIDNAVKYSPEGTTVTVRCGRDAEGVTLAVADEGVGIEPEHLPRLFERFYRTDKARSRAQGGTGLGLAIVKHIAQAHHGRVSVESRVGKGSTFRIHLPG